MLVTLSSPHHKRDLKMSPYYHEGCSWNCGLYSGNANKHKDILTECHFTLLCTAALLCTATIPAGTSNTEFGEGYLAVLLPRLFYMEQKAQVFMDKLQNHKGNQFLVIPFKFSTSQFPGQAS